jgi:hypothetical protein
MSETDKPAGIDLLTNMPQKGDEKASQPTV